MTFKQHQRRVRRAHSVPGSRAWKRLHRPKICVGGDCLCDRHEGVIDRLKSRAVSNVIGDREIKEQLH